MELNLQGKDDKESVLNKVETYIKSLSLKIAGEDRQRPWGWLFL